MGGPQGAATVQPEEVTAAQLKKQKVPASFGRR